MSNLPTKIDLTDDDVKTLEQSGIIPAGTPKPQIAVFAKICAERGLSAWSKEIHLVGYAGKYSVIVGINGFRKIAAESGLHAGTDDVKFDLMPDGSYKTAAEIKMAGRVPVSATCIVYRVVGNQRVPFAHTVLYSEFSTGKNKWQEMPFQMIAKVAEAFALRKAFPDRLTGINLEEEQAAFEGTTISAAPKQAESRNLDPKYADQYLQVQDALNSMDEFKQVLNYWLDFRTTDLAKIHIFNELFFERVAQVATEKQHLAEFWNEIGPLQKNTELTKYLSKRRQELESNGSRN